MREDSSQPEPTTGNLKALISGFDWSKTPLGPQAQWPDRLKAAVDLMMPSPAAMAILWGKQGTLLYNDAYAAIAGHRHPDMLGRPAHEAWPEFSEFLREVIDKVLGGASVSYRSKNLTANFDLGPRNFWFDLDFSPIADGTGKPAGVLAIVADTTERVLAERAHREGEERLRTLADGIAQFAWTADDRCRVSWFNKRWYEYTGTQPGETEGSGWHKVLHPEDASRVIEKFARCCEAGEVWEDTFRLRGADGSYRWFLSRAMPIRDDDGTIVRWFGTNTDITKEREAAAKNAELATIVSTSADAIISLSLAGEILSWNPGAEKLLGYSAEEVVGLSEAILFPEGHESEMEAKYARLIDGKSVHRDSVRRHKDGSLVDVAVSAAPIRRHDGRIIGFSAVLQDITERKRADARMRLVTRELSHRTKNLLAVIMSMVRQTARLSNSVDTFQEEFVQRLHAMSASHDLLVAEDWAGASLKELIDAVLQPFGGNCAGAVEAQGPDTFLNAHAVQNIAMALHELATNATKYGAMSVPSGRVAISWNVAEEGEHGRRLKFTWAESGGPPVKRPQRTGFGHIVVERVIRRALEADVSYRFEPKGVVWSISMPAALVMTDGLRRSG